LYTIYATSPYNSRLAQCELGNMYFCGHVCRKNQARAAELIRCSAEQGYGDAMHTLGFYHRYGWGGVQVEKAEGLSWFRRAVHYSKHGGAAAAIGDYYEWNANEISDKLGVADSSLMAKAWVSISATWGWKESQQILEKQELKPSPSVVGVWEVDIHSLFCF
jgi:TPR repeat protein